MFRVVKWYSILYLTYFIVLEVFQLLNCVLKFSLIHCILAVYLQVIIPKYQLQ